MIRIIFFSILVSLAAWSEPLLNCTAYPGPQNQGLVLVVKGNEEVTSLKLLTPIDHRYYLVKNNRTIIFLVPGTLPLWPSLLFKVNGTEIHYTNEVKASDFINPVTKGEV